LEKLRLFNTQEMSVLLLLWVGLICGVAGQHKIAVPSYWEPGNSDWARVVAGAPKVGFAIINPNSGPGASLDSKYQNQTKVCQQKQIKVVGYVHTSYGRRAQADVTTEIQRYFTWYNVDGIFLDEVATDCSLINYYLSVHDGILNHKSGSLVIINPGTATNECFTTVSDIICNYEDTYSKYNSSAYNQPSWINKYAANRFWHIVHTTLTMEQMQSVIKLSSARNAGIVYVTSERGDNPYARLPPANYWDAELTAA